MVKKVFVNYGHECVGNCVIATYTGMEMDSLLDVPNNQKNLSHLEFIIHLLGQRLPYDHYVETGVVNMVFGKKLPPRVQLFKTI
ncbi:MAG: hypothetical protein CM15mP71_1470 [Candidatus Poseidoniales archaeon]|nr:MAG: hypothetical protein CM15mP71_1470 [Candidatus Poseidoniales archaeon]